MKIEIEKSQCQGIDLVTKDSLILGLLKDGVYRYYTNEEQLTINFNCQIEEEKSQ